MVSNLQPGDACIVELDIVGFTSNYKNDDEKRAVLWVFQDLLNRTGKLITPYGLLTKRYIFQDTGDGCYLILDDIPPVVALAFVFALKEGLQDHNVATNGDLPLQLRCVLGFGRVEIVGTHLFGTVLADAERLISDKDFKEYQKTTGDACCLFLTTLFHQKLKQDIASDNEFPHLHHLLWSKCEITDKHDNTHIGYLLGDYHIDPNKAAKEEAPSEDNLALRIEVFIGGSIGDPLPEAVEFAHLLAQDMRQLALRIEIGFNKANRNGLQNAIRAGAQILVYYGHGLRDGNLAFDDGPLSAMEMNAILRTAPTTQAARTVFIGFACFGSLFCRELECAWLSFDQEVLRESPKAFILKLLDGWKGNTLDAAVRDVWDHLGAEVIEDLRPIFSSSTAALPRLALVAGCLTLRTRSARMDGLSAYGFLEFTVGRVRYPGFDPFVGREQELASLLTLPARSSLSKAQTVQWVWGAPGIGKSSLLRQAAVYAAETVFLPEHERVVLVHVACEEFVDPRDILARLRAAFKRLGFEAADEGIQGLFAALRKTSGSYMILLDDLSYLDTEGLEKAETLVGNLVEAARAESCRCKIIASSRKRPAPHFNPLPLDPLSAPELMRLGEKVWRQGTKTDIEPHDRLAVLQIAGFVKSNTALLKNALASSAKTAKKYSDYYQDLGHDRSLAAEDEAELAINMIRHNADLLSGREGADCFRYTAFLGTLYPLIVRVGPFGRQELDEWFGGHFINRTTCHETKKQRTAYDRGLETVLYAGFLVASADSEGQAVYDMPPNLRLPLRELALRGEDKATLSLIKKIEPRHASRRLALAMELIEKNPPMAIGEFAAIEADYKDDAQHPDIAPAFAMALLIRAELSGLVDKNEEIRIYDEVIARFKDRPEPQIADKVATAMANKGSALGKLNRSEEAVTVYDEVVARFKDRPEPRFAAQVAMAMGNKGVRLGALNRSEEAIAAYDEVVARFKDRPEPQIAEKVARAMFNKGGTLAALNRPAEEITAYDEVIVRFEDRPEPQIAEQVAMAMVNKGVILGELNRPEEAITVYDEVVARFRGRPEPQIAQQVAMAMFNKGVRFNSLNRSEEAITAYDGLVSRFKDRPEPQLAKRVAKAMVNKGVTLGALNRPEEEIAVYDEVIARFKDRPEPQLAEQVAKAEVALALSKTPAAIPGKITELVEAYQHTNPAVAAAILGILAQIKT